MLAEFFALVTFGAWSMPAALLRLLPGALILVALRAALTGADWRWIAAALALSFPAHVADLVHRPRR